MINLLKNILNNQNSQEDHNNRDLELLSGLMIEAAYTDGKIDASELSKIILSLINFDDEKKILLIEALWEIVLSDGEIHDFESSLIRRLAGLLYISDVVSGNAKKRALNKIQK